MQKAGAYLEKDALSFEERLFLLDHWQEQSVC
jgi:hypothetical protein